jgi:hypothetical protein
MAYRDLLHAYTHPESKFRDLHECIGKFQTFSEDHMADVVLLVMDSYKSTYVERFQKIAPKATTDYLDLDQVATRSVDGTDSYIRKLALRDGFPIRITEFPDRTIIGCASRNSRSVATEITAQLEKVKNLTSRLDEFVLNAPQMVAVSMAISASADDAKGGPSRLMDNLPDRGARSYRDDRRERLSPGGQVDDDLDVQDEDRHNHSAPSPTMTYHAADDATSMSENDFETDEVMTSMQ